MDVPTGTTRGPSLLGAVPGEYGSPAKAVTEALTTAGMGEAMDPHWPPSKLIDVNDEDAVYQWAIEASLEDARRRRAAQALNGKETVSAATKRKPDVQSSQKAPTQGLKHQRLDDLQIDRQRLAKRDKHADLPEHIPTAAICTQERILSNECASTGTIAKHQPGQENAGGTSECVATRDSATRGPSGSSPLMTTTGCKRSSRTRVLLDDFELDRKRVKSSRSDPPGGMVPNQMGSGSTVSNEKCRTTSDLSVSPVVCTATDAPT